MGSAKAVIDKAAAARRKIVRLDPSPLNRRIKLATLECGHDVWLQPHVRPRRGMMVVCPTCFDPPRKK